MQASFFRYILNWTLFRISRKIKRNESQIFIIGKLFLIRHPCHVLSCRVPYMSRPSLSCYLSRPSLSCSLHVTFLPCRVPYMSRSFLPTCLCQVPSLSAFLLTFFPFLLVLVTSSSLQLSLSRSFFSQLSSSLSSCSALLVILLPF